VRLRGDPSWPLRRGRITWGPRVEQTGRFTPGRRARFFFSAPLPHALSPSVYPQVETRVHAAVGTQLRLRRQLRQCDHLPECSHGRSAVVDALRGNSRLRTTHLTLYPLALTRSKRRRRRASCQLEVARYVPHVVPARAYKVGASSQTRFVPTRGCALRTSRCTRSRSLLRRPRRPRERQRTRTHGHTRGKSLGGRGARKKIRVRLPGVNLPVCSTRGSQVILPRRNGKEGSPRRRTQDPPYEETVQSQVIPGKAHSDFFSSPPPPQASVKRLRRALRRPCRRRCTWSRPRT
jgi:hypothetical protein